LQIVALNGKFAIFRCSYGNFVALNGKFVALNGNFALIRCDFGNFRQLCANSLRFRQLSATLR
jgi:hypothetical protein